LILILTILLLLILIFDKTCHTVPMMLITNTYLSGLMNGCIMLSLALFTLQNDLKQIEYEDSLCVFRGYIIYTSAASFYYSFLIQAVYRYLISIYPTRLLFQSFRFQILIICSSWLFCFVYPFTFVFDGQTIYSSNNQICQLPLSFSFSTIYMTSCLFLFPTSLIMFIYLKLILYVRQMSRNATTANTWIRAQRELKMVRRIVILITVLTIICLPFTIFMFMGFFNDVPKYDFRISYAFVDSAGLATEIALFQFTDPLKACVMKIIKWRPNRIFPSVT
jgi:hypothetical protein